jgi:uncharacterized protein YcfL
MKKPAFIALLMGLAGGCASEPTNLDARFGDSVEQMVVHQTYNPSASQTNESRTPKTLDGQKAAKTLENYRKADPKAAKSQRITEFDFGD